MRIAWLVASAGLVVAAAIGSVAQAQNAPAPAAATGATAAGTMTADEILKIIVWATKPVPKSEVARMLVALGKGAGPREDYARARLLVLSGQGNEGRELMRALIKKEAGVADYQAFLGSAIFATVQNESALGMKSLADEGMAAYEKAIELDPGQVEARVGLAQIYVNAPALMGGSYSKARAQAQALFDNPKSGGEYQARIVLATVAAHKEEWEEMEKQFALAAKTSGVGASSTGAKISHAFALLQTKKDPAAAWKVVEGIDVEQAKDNSSLFAVRGLSLARLKRWSEAEPELRRTLELNPDAQLSRYTHGECLENLGTLDKARAEYQEYVARFPKGTKIDDANAGIKRIDKSLKK